MSRLTRISVLLGFFLLVDKGLAILRQVIIARQFSFSSALDVFNVANNIPDLLFALISGGALAMAFIPVLAEVLTKQGKREAWDLFSRIANLAFLITAILAVVVALLADPIVKSEVGVAPGFTLEQQQSVIGLMRLNLIATLIFSISGLVMAGLQSNQHFLLPAMAPLLYNVGQIFGALILAPTEGYIIAGFKLPAFGLGIQGLVYGVILGAIMHLGIQLPGLVKYHFHWIPQLGLNHPDVRKVLRLMAPRLATMMLIQLIFIVRDNLGSRLAEGSVSALTYGWMIQQVPETVIGTAIGIALLPTLAELVTKKQDLEFKLTIERAVRVLISLAIPIAVILAMGVRPLLELAFGLGASGTDLLLWTTRGFLAGLAGHCLMEVAARSFYARQDAITPLKTAALNLVVYVILGVILYNGMGAPGIGLTDSLAFTGQAVLLLFLLNRRLPGGIQVGKNLFRAIAAGVVGGLVCFLGLQITADRIPEVVGAMLAMAVGIFAALPVIWQEIKLLLRL